MFIVDEVAGTITLAAGETATGALTIPNDMAWLIEVAGTFEGVFDLEEPRSFGFAFTITETGGVFLENSQGIILELEDSLINRGEIGRAPGEDDFLGGVVSITGAKVSNFGTIDGGGASIVTAPGDAASYIFNHGSLFGSIISVVLGAQGDRLFNSGTIEGLDGDDLGWGIVATGDNSRIANSAEGVISSSSAAVLVFGEGTVARNEGSILQTGDGDGVGIALNGSNHRVLNTGLIQVEGVGIESEADTSKIVNTGTIETLNSAGDSDNVALSLSGDGIVLRNSGSIFGKVDFGDGDARYLGADGSVDAGIFLGAGDDVAKGGAGDERILGQRGNDRIEGRGGKDDLLGGGGDDRISGGAGADEITGGRGNDKMEGGSGADVFVFDLRSDDDVILDFEGRDRLDLTALGVEEGDVLDAARDIAAGVVIDLDALGGDGRVLLAGLSRADLSDGFLL